MKTPKPEQSTPEARVMVSPEGPDRRTSSDVTMGFLVPKFLDYARFDLYLAEQTVAKYKESLNWFMRDVPHVDTPLNLSLEDVTVLKKEMISRGVGASRVNSVIFALRKFLYYCRQVRNLQTINPADIKPMKVPPREVIFLLPEEVNQFRNSFNTETAQGLRMRVLVEVLLASALRISEALSLNRDDINWEEKETKIVGKGNKERLVFFTEDALTWIRKYLATRTDSNPALFIAFGTKGRLQRYDLGKQFRRYAQKAGIKKKLTPHILRHTAATIMLRNGCPLTYIQEILGHADIKTTAKYYLGTDKRSLKEAHAKFLKFDGLGI